MSDTAQLQIPDEIRAKFAEILELIIASESMNNEERQYWINILPIMTPEQLENLQSILVNEKKQLQAIDKKYAEDIESLGQEESIEKTAEERRSKREDRLQKESAAEEKESTAIEDVLEQIDSL